MAGRKLLTPVRTVKQCFKPTTLGRRTLRRAADCRVTPASEPKALPRYPGAVSTSLPPLNGNLPVSRTVSVYSRSRFPTEGCTWPFPVYRGQRQPSSVSHRREFARRQRFCRAGKLQLEFLRKRKRDFFSYPTYTNAQTSSLYNALIPIPQNSLNATFPNCPFPVPKLSWVSSQISSDLLYRSYGECVSGSVLLYGISFYRFL